MKARILIGLAALTAFAAPMAAEAQSWRGDRDRDGRYERSERRSDNRDWRQDRRDDRREWRQDRRDDRREYRQDRRQYYGDNRRYDRPNYYAPRRDYSYGYGYGYQQPRRWYRGATIPYDYRRSWYVNDYRPYGWAPPPRGYGYYRTDTGDIVLAAIATGVILSLLND